MYRKKTFFNKSISVLTAIIITLSCTVVAYTSESEEYDAVITDTEILTDEIPTEQVLEETASEDPGVEMQENIQIEVVVEETAPDNNTAEEDASEGENGETQEITESVSLETITVSEIDVLETDETESSTLTDTDTVNENQTEDFVNDTESVEETELMSEIESNTETEIEAESETDLFMSEEDRLVFQMTYEDHSIDTLSKLDEHEVGSAIQWVDPDLLSEVLEDSDWILDLNYTDKEDLYETYETEDFSLKYQMTFYTGIDIEKNAVEIRIPEKLAIDRWENDIVPSCIGTIEYDPNEEDECLGSDDTLFGYYFDDKTKEIVFVNYKKIPAGTIAAWQVLYENIQIFDLVDGSKWDLKPVIEVDGYEEYSDENTGLTQKLAQTGLKGMINTGISLETHLETVYSDLENQSVYNSLSQALTILPDAAELSGFLDDTGSEEDLVYMVWKITDKGSASQPWKLYLDNTSSAFIGENEVTGTVTTVISYILNGSGEVLKRNVIEADLEGLYAGSYKIGGFDDIQDNDGLKDIFIESYVITAYPNTVFEGETLVRNKTVAYLNPADGIDPDIMMESSTDWFYQPEAEEDCTEEGIDTLSLDDVSDYSMKISVTDETGSFLFGVELQLIDEEGRVVHEWISGTDVETIYGLELGTYLIHENAVPDGYWQAADKTIDLTEDSAAFTVTNKKIQTIPVYINISGISDESVVFGLYDSASQEKISEATSENNGMLSFPSEVEYRKEYVIHKEDTDNTNVTKNASSGDIVFTVYDSISSMYAAMGISTLSDGDNVSDGPVVVVGDYVYEYTETSEQAEEEVPAYIALSSSSENEAAVYFNLLSEEVAACYSLHITNVNSSGELLPEAHFELYTDKDLTEKLAEGVCDSNGSVSFSDLKNGVIYYLKETQSPEGYSLLTSALPFSLDVETGIATVNGITYETDENASISVKTEEDDSISLSIRITNYKGFELPDSGGNGIIVRTLISLVGIMILLLLLSKNAMLLLSKNAKYWK